MLLEVEPVGIGRREGKKREGGERFSLSHFVCTQIHCHLPSIFFGKDFEKVVRRSLCSKMSEWGIGDHHSLSLSFKGRKSAFLQYVFGFPSLLPSYHKKKRES